MVRGRRVRTVASVTKGIEACDSPKRKDQRLDFQGKLAHTMVSTKSQIITNFFQVVQEHNVKLLENQAFINEQCPTVIDLNGCTETLDRNESIVEKNSDETIVSVSTTPHRIELCPDLQPVNELPLIHKAPAPKAKRKLNANQKTDQVLCASKDDILNKNNGTLANNHTLTEYFPVRRSVRKTKRTVLEEKQRTLEKCVRNEIEDGLEVQNFASKGRGVITSQPFSKGDFVVEYRGELIDMTEAKRREQRYAEDQNTGCYMYYFKHKNMQYCVDATGETSYLGRLVNHSRNGNLITRTVTVDGLPRLVLIAKENIAVGEEITYDYGDRSKESLRYHPWLAT